MVRQLSAMYELMLWFLFSATFFELMCSFFHNVNSWIHLYSQIFHDSGNLGFLFVSCRLENVPKLAYIQQVYVRMCAYFFS